MCTENYRTLMKIYINNEYAVFMIGRFIIKFICKSIGPKTEMPISRNNKEGGSIEPDSKWH